MTDRFRQGNRQKRNVYDDAQLAEDGDPGSGRWMCTAGDPYDAWLICTALNNMDKVSREELGHGLS